MFSRKIYGADPNCAFLSEKNAGLGVIANITSVRNRNLGLNCDIGMKLTAPSNVKVENSPSELCSRFRNEIVYVLRGYKKRNHPALFCRDVHLLYVITTRNQAHNS
ncbi:hypothetical protein AVEN_197611-1 [Araneus ventricosus]|uniref:Uncharacterized protein n=1 Tax=Araneus ventricosus TaxID=182803 RepID=A0A4Y2SYE7_ARAVE|nr:hypothetical protein AVEN_197611-1 [Araneus ventricosus]